jgi:hypothetical protein
MRDTTSAPLLAEDLRALRAMAETGDGILVADFDVSEGTMIRALAGKAVKAVTARRIRLGLERLAKQKGASKTCCRWHAGGGAPGPCMIASPREIAEATGASALVCAPVCPRCLDLTPGTPGGEPETPHPGPFTEDLCAACHKAIDASLEPEERAEARRVRAAREKAVKP